MSKFVVTGGKRLQGIVRVSGSKNSTSALMFAAAMGKDDVILTNIPLNSDVITMSEILKSIGVQVKFDGPTAIINGANITSHQPPYELVRRIRASVYTAGLLLGRLGMADVAMPGGDEIGTRPIDLHMRGFQALGAEVLIEHGQMVCKSFGLKGSTCYINKVSVGATINIMLAAALAEGITIIDNPAKEPEVVDCAILLNSMGAKIRGAGTASIKIEGVERLHGCEHTPIPDRIEAGTFMIATAATGGDVQINNVITEHLRMVISKLREAGAEIIEGDNDIRIICNQRLKTVDVDTGVYPGFATDLQAPFGVLLSKAEGTGIICETVFDNRFRYIDELRRMGADIKVERDTAIFRGVERLSGAPVVGTDIRAGVALVIAGLMAEGSTEVSGINHIDRGYENFDEKLKELGAGIQRVAESLEEVKA